jgi:diguanylate cyclase (GGDEF)-like protein
LTLETDLAPQTLARMRWGTVVVLTLDLLVLGVVFFVSDPQARALLLLSSVGLLGVLAAIAWSASVRMRDLLQSQAAERERRQALVDALPIGLVLYDAADRFEFANRDFRDLYPPLRDLLVPGVPFSALVEASLERGLIPEAAGREAEWLERRLAAHRNPSGPVMRRQADGRWRRIVEQRLADGSVLAHSVDVTDLVRREEELAAANAELERLSLTDALTGLANRRAFDQRLAMELARAARHDMPMSLLLADVDHFKRFNDRHGHGEGDRCLQRVALLLAAQLRRPPDLAARLGGEEFAIVLPHVDAAGGQQVARRCIAAFEAAAIPHGDSPVAPHVTLSFGLAVVRPGSGPRQPDALLAQADAALYRAKAEGRGRCEVAADL